MEGYSKRKGLIAKGEKTLLKRHFSGSNERLEFTFLTKSEPPYFLLNYKFLSNLLGCIIKIVVRKCLVRRYILLQEKMIWWFSKIWVEK